MAADPLDHLAGVYARFAAHEAAGRSSLYEELSTGVAGDREILGLLAKLPPAKQQPNLVLASARYVCGMPDGWVQFRGWVLDRWDEILAVILARRAGQIQAVRAVLTAGAARGHHPHGGDPDALAEYLVGTAQTLALLHRAGAAPATLTSLAQTALHVLRPAINSADAHDAPHPSQQLDGPPDEPPHEPPAG